MKKRCFNPQLKDAKYYRGIKLCKRWFSFENFFRDMGKAPSKMHSIDRIDNRLGYSPKNCRWATSKEQSLNRRHIKRHLFDGALLTREEICKKVGLNKSQLHSRLKRKGGDIYRVVYGVKS